MYREPKNQIQKLENEIFKLTEQLAAARRDHPPEAVSNYEFASLTGPVRLLDLFVGKSVLFAIHNMGQACRYCTTWADGFNAFLPHLEDQFSVVLMSKDSPSIQRQFANSRGWRFRMVSHAGTTYMKDQNVISGGANSPGIVVYTRTDDKIFKKNASVFGPGDQFCSLWSLLSLAGFNAENWTPQFQYWQRPEKLDDGGQNLR